MYLRPEGVNTPLTKLWNFKGLERSRGMTPTLTLKTEDLIQSLRNRAEAYRLSSQNHRVDPAVADMYAQRSQDCDLEACALEARQLLKAVQADPFAAAMAEAGATEIRLGRENTQENGHQRAPRSTLRGQWPFGETKALEAPKPLRQWPF